MRESPYTFSAEPSGTHAIILSEVPPQSKVLDVGCAGGYLGEFLSTYKGCEVWGIEPREQRANTSLQIYKQVINAPIEKALNEGVLEEASFDVIILGDVLEHLPAPEEVLQKLKKYLQPRGRMVISLPNVAHYSVRCSLLFGKWDMADSGILDRTHLHFYTFKSAQQLITAQGLHIERYRPRGDLERWFRKIGLEAVGKKILYFFPGLFAFQFIFVAENS